MIEPFKGVMEGYIFPLIDFLLEHNRGGLVVSMGSIVILGFECQKNRKKIKELVRELEMYQRYEETFQTLLKEVRGRQHDFDNHINAIYSQHYTCETLEELVEKQREYSQVITKNNRYNKLLYLGNTMMIGFLYEKFLYAEEKNIEVKYRFLVKDLKSSVPEYKLVELVGNLIDNAIEAVQKDTVSKKEIILELTETEEKIILTISNPYRYLSQKEVLSMFQWGNSTKGSSRGLGLYNVKRICREYHWDIYVKNKTVEKQNYVEFRVEIEK